MNCMFLNDGRTDRRIDGWMDGQMDVLEVAPGAGREAVIMQLIVTQIQQPQVAAALQRLLCHPVNHVPAHLQCL